MFNDDYYNDSESSSNMDDYLIFNNNYNSIHNDNENEINFNTSLESDKNNYYYIKEEENSTSEKKNSTVEKKNNTVEKKKNFLGRKTKKSGETGKHTKDSEDNKIRKIKGIFRDDLLNFINEKIKKLNLNISDIDFDHTKYKGIKIELLKTNPKQINDTSVNGNKNLFITTIGNFFSDDLSSSYRLYPSNFNALLIAKIYEVDKEKEVTSILDKKYLECLQYFRKDEKSINGKDECLKGLETKFCELKGKLSGKGHEEQYIEDVIRLIKDFENIYYKKTARKNRKKSI